MKRAQVRSVVKGHGVGTTPTAEGQNTTDNISTPTSPLCSVLSVVSSHLFPTVYAGAAGGGLEPQVKCVFSHWQTGGTKQKRVFSKVRIKKSSF